MIGSISGKIKYKSANYVIVETSGIGYKVFVPQSLLFSLKLAQPIDLVIHTYVREDQLTLFGFLTLEELEFFEMLLTVSGVGPKSALGIMSLESVSMIKSAIVSEDPSVFTKVSGIGRKTAERVIVELKEKVRTETDSVGAAKEHTDALDALISLGYSQQQAREALKAVPAAVKDIQDKVKLALKYLTK
ncbi:MAG: Holliday junction branch migration protein RuvA [Acidobacteriaceae bacterium]